MTTTATPATEQQPSNRVWTIDAIRSLGATTDIETAGAILGIGRSKSYELAKWSSALIRRGSRGEREG